MLNSNEINIKELLKYYKDNNQSIDIYDNNNIIVGKLISIGNIYNENENIIELLMNWRNNAIHAYLEQSMASFEGTGKWLTNALINNENRILFFIEDLNGKKIGHIGLNSFNYLENTCEIDNVVRGEKSEKGIMTFALMNLINFTKEKLNINNIFLRVFNDNLPAKNLYFRCNFVNNKLIPLSKKLENGIIKYSEIDSKELDIKADNYFQSMSICNNNHFINKSKSIRRNILKIIFKSKSSHIGSALSVVDILNYIYSIINNGDKVILSKGHAGSALYSTLTEYGYINNNYLINNYCTNGSKIGGHVTLGSVEGIDATAGSLGHGLAIGIGLALGNPNNNIYVILGDGELNEGSVWEGIMFLAHKKLKNIVIIVDSNKQQSFGYTKNTINISNLKGVISNFGLNILECDGNDYESLNKVFNNLNKLNTNFIVANTIKGKGISYMEDNVDFHYRPPNEYEYNIGLKELGEIH